MMDLSSHLSTFALLLHAVLVAVIAIRVIMKKPATGVALAWLFLVSILPYLGAFIYLLVGERRISQTRAQRIAALRIESQLLHAAAVREGLTEVDWSRHPPAARAMDRLGRHTIGMPTVHGSRFTLHSDAKETLTAIAREVDRAHTSVLMEFYIWSEGGKGDEVLEAVIRAAGRGVRCRLLIDALGSRPWWRGKQPQLLRDNGVQVLPALPVGVIHTFVGRNDLRLHRKIVVIDGRLAWTGSMNLVDPSLFKKHVGVGEWIDAMVQIEGAAVAPLAAILIGDWQLETGEPIHELVEDARLRLVEPVGEADVQVVPSGPEETDDGLLQMLIALINAASEEIVLTTPYFVPDDSLLRVLRGAAGRGVKVMLILPEKADSSLTRHAGRSYYDELLELGVEIHLFQGGLLHSKAITVDGAMSMFGTVNFDMRSLWLNYEVALFVYDREFTAELRALQERYLRKCERLDPEQWKRRPFLQRFVQNSARLVGPLL
jgi:cardiolipin synthase